MKKPKEIQRQYYTDTAPLYNTMHISADDEHYVALKYISSLVSLLGISSVLDVGCGTGRGVKYFGERNFGMKVLGIEPVWALIDQAIHKNGIPTELLVCVFRQ